MCCWIIEFATRSLTRMHSAAFVVFLFTDYSQNKTSVLSSAVSLAVFARRGPLVVAQGW